MCLCRETNISSCIFVSLLAMTIIVARSDFVFSGEPPVVAAIPVQTTKADVEKSKTAIKDPKLDLRTRIENSQTSSGQWSRTPARRTGKWTTSASTSETQPKIRFVSASGTEESTVSAADETTASDNPATSVEESTPVAGNEHVSTDETTLVPAFSLSVKEQLLDALRAQRNARAGTMRPSTSPGSLTIMHSPKVAVRQPAASAEIPQPTTSSLPALTTDDSKFSTEEVQPKSSKSHIGLTRTLEEDLKSNNPYERERAQRYLRLEMQLLQLRSRRTEAAGITTLENTNRQTENPPESHENGNDTSAEVGKGMESQFSGRDAIVDTAHNVDPNKTGYSDLADQPGNDTVEIATAPLLPESTNHSPNAFLVNSIVVEGPIDRLGLANNLFAVGEYPLALEMYAQTSGPELTSRQQFWIAYQTANCLYHLGKTSEASNRYRKLASQPEAGWLCQQAQWWVEILESIRIHEKALAENGVSHCRTIIEEVENAGTQRAIEYSGTPTISNAPIQAEP